MSWSDLKAQGNGAFAEGKYDEAYTHFSEALKVAPNDQLHILYSNRSATLASLGRNEEALEDAKRVVELNPGFMKGYLRTAMAYLALGNFAQAEAACRKGLEKFPGNESFTAALADIEAARKATPVEEGAEMNVEKPASPAPAAPAVPEAAPPAPLATTPSPPPTSAPAPESKEDKWKAMFADVWTKVAAHPDLANSASDPEFVAKVNEIARDPAAMANYIGDPKIQLLLNVLTSHAAKAKPAAAAAPASPPKAAPRPVASKPATPAKRARQEPPPGLSEEEREKFIGNEDFNELKFEDAVRHYDCVLELNPNNYVVIGNKAACYFEMGARAQPPQRDEYFEKCVTLCQEAIEKGRAQHADFKLVAKNFARIGNARYRQGRLKEALDAYDHSLTENRLPEVVKKRAEVEKELKEAERRAYLNPEIAEQERIKGNEFFQAGKFPEAVQAYTESIARNPNDARVYSNRAACFIKLMRWPEALNDCEEAIKLDPNFLKAHIRKGQVQFFLKQYPQAMKSYEAALKLDPENTDAIEGLQRVMRVVQEKQASGQVDEEQVREAMKDPEIRAIVQDPVIQNVLQEISANPMAAQKHLQNPKIMDAINKLAVAGVLKLRTQ